jgi:hypothetical protein
LDIAMNTLREARFFQRFTKNFALHWICGKNDEE